jgi:transglutaminase-like putative cysteine protease
LTTDNRFILTLAAFLLLTCSACTSSRSTLGDEPIPDRQLRMTDYPADTNATAVILRDEGHVEVKSGGGIVFERFRRVKLLSEEGYDHATVHIPYHTGKNGQRVRKIEGHTITANPDSGGVEYHPLKEKSIFREDVAADRKRVRFTLPALEPGAIVEFHYEKTSENPLFLPDWQFQFDEPVLWSEYVAEIPDYFRYVRTKTGGLSFDVKNSKRVTSAGPRAQKFRWVIKDAPALREEPFMTTLSDYRTALEFQLAAMRLPGQATTTQVMNTWDRLARDLAGNPSFGQRLESTGNLRRQTERVLSDTASAREKMIALYDYVRENMTWTGARAVFAGHDLDAVLEAKKGNSAELAMLLTMMLREAGLQADPVLISTRSHGRVMDKYPMVDQFNDLLVRAVAGGESFLLAPTDPMRPYDLLPPEALNEKGWVMDPDNPRWIKLRTSRRFHRRLLVRGELTPDGGFDGTLEVIDKGYAALRSRHALEEGEKKEFARGELFSEHGNARINEVSVSNEKQAPRPLKTKIHFAMPSYAQSASDYLYAGSFPVHLLSENPLRQPDRTFPLNLNFPRDITYTLNLKLPDGYAVKDLPKDKRFRVAGGEASFSRMIDEQSGTVTMRMRHVMNRSMYPARVYDRMRSLFDEIISAQNSQIVLQRASEPVTSSK